MLLPVLERPYCENQAEMVKRFGKNIYIAYDGDDAGIKAI